MGSHVWIDRRRAGIGLTAIVMAASIGIPAVSVAETASSQASGDSAKTRSQVSGDSLDSRSHVAAAADFEELGVVATESGSVRVIVHLKMLWTPEPLLDSIARSEQTLTLAEAQAAIVASLNGTDFRVAHRYKYTPYIALELDANAVRALAASGLAAAVQLDTADPVALGDSVPLVNADDAWTSGYDGSGQVVAVLDTGVDGTHPFLAGKIVDEACFSLGGDCPNASTVQLGAGSGVHCTYSGDCDHGTHVAGIAAGLAQPGDSGVARGADIIAVQVFSRFDSSSDCGGSPPCALSYSSDQLAGLEQVFALRDTHEVASVNMSIGGGRYYAACDDDFRKAAIDNLRAAGIPTVISAGNSGYDDSTGKPACISTAVSVASSTKGDARSSFSNTASFVDLIAPGSSILSSVPGGGYSSYNGTSMAAPHVAGAWAIVKQAFPEALVSDVLVAFQSTGPDIQVRSGPDEFLPRIDIAAALADIVVTPLPANDDYENAEAVVAPASVVASTGMATTEPGEPLTCDDPDTGLVAAGATLWYSLAPAEDVEVAIDTAGSGFDTIVAVYTGNTLGALSQTACDDDTPGKGSQAHLTFIAPVGATYWIQIGGFGSPAAVGDLNLSVTATPYDSTAPVWPAGTALDASGIYADRMKLSWSGAEDAGGISEYAVSLNGTVVTTTSARSTEVSGLSPATSYAVQIQAVDANGNWSDGGPTATFTTAQRFTDTDGSVFEQDIEWLSGASITAGCNPPSNDEYCPGSYVTRGQMAAFLVRALGLSNAGTGDLFGDDDGSIFEGAIDRLGTAGVTLGCNPPLNDRFCPGDFVTRGQMAAFLVRAVGYTDAGEGDLFGDDDGTVFEGAIDLLGTAGVTLGCNPPLNDRFCPGDFVTRGQMAAFLRRALS